MHFTENEESISDCDFKANFQTHFEKQGRWTIARARLQSIKHFRPPTLLTIKTMMVWSEPVDRIS